MLDLADLVQLEYGDCRTRVRDAFGALLEQSLIDGDVSMYNVRDTQRTRARGRDRRTSHSGTRRIAAFPENVPAPNVQSPCSAKRSTTASTFLASYASRNRLATACTAASESALGDAG